MELDEVLQLDCQNVLIPSGELSNAVVREAIGAKLIGGQTADAQDRDLLDTQPPCSVHAAMAGDDCIISINQNRVHEAELAHRRHDDSDLLFVVGASITLIGLESGRSESTRSCRP